MTQHNTEGKEPLAPAPGSVTVVGDKTVAGDLPGCGGARGAGRRSFFFWFSALVGALAGLLAGVPVIGYFVSVKRREIHWVSLGPVEGFTIGETRLATFDNPLRQPWDGVVAQTGVYVRRETPAADGAAKFLILAINCAHLGCPVSWFPQSGLFMCPCHGGVYYADGNRASGPPPRGLFRCVWRLTGDDLEIQAPHYPTLQDTLTDDAKSENVRTK